MEALLLDNLSTPVKYAVIGCIALIIGWFISRALFGLTGTPWWASALAGAVGGYIGGWLNERRNQR